MESENKRQIRNDPLYKESVIDKAPIDCSTGIIDATIRKTNLEIDSIQTSNERHEKERRFGEELKRQSRYSQIQLDTMKAGRKNAELEMRWSEYREMEECQELYHNLNDHKKLFNELIESKQKLIKELTDTLNQKDSEYNKSIERMKQEIDVIAKSMRNQFKELRNTSIKELEDIEAELSNQREKLIDENYKKIKSKFEEHKKSEDDGVGKRKQQKNDNKRELDNLITDSEIKFADLKIKSETEIQNCEKCFEDMKALYQLNAEKLKYNFKVLSGKKTENTQLKSELKKKERFFSNMYKGKKDDYKKKDIQFKKENKKLTEQYRMISKQYKDLHKKFKHFKKADIERYDEIKEMNLKEIEEMKRTILNCDQIIHMQQLGVVWEDPTIDTNESMEGEEEENMEDMASASFGGMNESNTMNNEKRSHLRSEENIDLEEEREQYIVPPIEINAILNVVLEETDFLLDDKIMSEISKRPPKEKLLLKMNVLRKVLAIGDDLEFNKLLWRIWQTTDPEDPQPNPQLDLGNEDQDNLSHSNTQLNKSSDLQQEDEVNDEGEEEMEAENFYSREELEDAMEQYDPDSLIMLLGDFIEDKKNKIVLNNADQKKKKSLEREKKEKELKKEKMDWELRSRVLPEERVMMWKILDKISSKYYKLLLERQKLIKETSDLHNQNDELNNLLNQYLNINHNLLVPPTSVIKVNFLE